MSTTAEDRGWGTGWPNCQTGTVKVLARPDGLRLPVRKEILPLVAWLIDETERRGYDIIHTSTWGYACRAIRGYEVASNHSWALAIDLNAPTNGMVFGKPGWKWLHDTGHTDMPDWLPGLWIKYGFLWGGNYTKRQDPMHFEFVGTPSDAARYIASLTNPAKVWIAPPYPGYALRVGSRGRSVLVWKMILKGAGFGAHVDLSSDLFGAGTKTATALVQTKMYLAEKRTPPAGQPSGIAGPATWRFGTEMVKLNKALGKNY